MSKLTGPKIKDLTYADTASKRSGIFTVRRGFFYTHGKTASDFANSIKEDLAKAGYEIEIIGKGEVWKPFKGGASVANSSHWWVKFIVKGDAK